MLRYFAELLEISQDDTIGQIFFVNPLDIFTIKTKTLAGSDATIKIYQSSRLSDFSKDGMFFIFFQFVSPHHLPCDMFELAIIHRYLCKKSKILYDNYEHVTLKDFFDLRIRELCGILKNDEKAIKNVFYFCQFITTGEVNEYKN
jgi:hypothetical protein